MLGDLYLSKLRWLTYAEVYPGGAHTVTGDVRVLRGISSHGLAARDVLVYLPPGYASAPEKRYPVLYMHDGQNVFDAATSYAGEWGADEAAGELAGRGLETIIVAIPNAGAARVDEYGPWATAKSGQKMGGKGNAYVDFLLDTVRPAVDGSWRTLTDTAHTGIAGSSMGGLISLYAALSRPGVFGYCAALSPSLWLAQERIFDLAARRRGSKPRIYLDMGLLEGDAHARRVRKLKDRLEKSGFDVAHLEDEHGAHSEEAWRRRFPAALEWFLDPTARPGAPRPTHASALRSILPRLARLLPSRS